MPLAYYPLCDIRSQNFLGNQYYPQDRRESFVDSVVLHTTEGTGWPSYGGGASSPTMTFNPLTLDARQHIPFNMPARALRDLSGGSRTNWGGVVQIEIIGTSGWASTENPSRPYTIDDKWKSANMSEDAKRWLGAFAKWLNNECGVPLNSPVPFLNWNQNGRRFTTSEWDSFSGWTGHARVPENDHSDPGPIDIYSILAYAAGIPGTGGGSSAMTPIKYWDGSSFPGAGAFQIGKSHPATTLLGERLVAHGWTGYSYGPSPVFSETDRTGVAWFQRNQGWTGSDADGVPGPVTWQRLMAAPGGSTPPAPVTATRQLLSVKQLRDCYEAHPNGPSSWTHPMVGPVQEMLHTVGYLTAIHTYGHYGTSVVQAVRMYQRSLGHAADGWLGPIELSTLIDQSGRGGDFTAAE